MHCNHHDFNDQHQDHCNANGNYNFRMRMKVALSRFFSAKTTITTFIPPLFLCPSSEKWRMTVKVGVGSWGWLLSAPASSLSSLVALHLSSIIQVTHPLACVLPGLLSKTQKSLQRRTLEIAKSPKRLICVRRGSLKVWFERNCSVVCSFFTSVHQCYLAQWQCVSCFL